MAMTATERKRKQRARRRAARSCIDCGSAEVEQGGRCHKCWQLHRCGCHKFHGTSGCRECGAHTLGPRICPVCAWKTAFRRLVTTGVGGPRNLNSLPRQILWSIPAVWRTINGGLGTYFTAFSYILCDLNREERETVNAWLRSLGVPDEEVHWNKVQYPLMVALTYQDFDSFEKLLRTVNEIRSMKCDSTTPPLSVSLT